MRILRAKLLSSAGETAQDSAILASNVSSYESPYLNDAIVVVKD